MSTNWHNLVLNAKRSPRLVWGSSLGIGAIVYLKVWLPATNIAVPCLFHELTGLYCPGCGMTRAAVSLLQLDFYQAFRYNPLPFVLVPLYLLYLPAMKKSPRIGSVIMTVMLTLTLIFGLLRNIPAFDWLAPTSVR